MPLQSVCICLCKAGQIFTYILIHIYLYVYAQAYVYLLRVPTRKHNNIGFNLTLKDAILRRLSEQPKLAILKHG